LGADIFPEFLDMEGAVGVLGAEFEDGWRDPGKDAIAFAAVVISHRL
jgi:hypothetical protein